ncbi:MAG: aminotransferase class I/II-fold pyridoxal phosphate-dependent enzyme [Clostridia bacterium]|nr:aminotransferase class I/II-fold pyridoxal phosphate-dependent enzyme [Clostridia bacterium]
MLYSEMSKVQLEEEISALREEFENLKSMNLKLNMSRGIPSKDQLELSHPMLDILNSSSDFISADGADCRNYGGIDGIGEAKQLFADLFEVSTDEIIVGGNSSLSMMFDTITSAMAHGLLGSTPWARQNVKFLCPCPGYDRHFAITEYYGIEMIPVQMFDDGPDMDFIEKAVASDPLIKGIWCVPKYSNPTGVTYSDETVRRFAALRPAAEDFRIFWDNAYFVHHLFGDDRKLLNLLDECKKTGNTNMVYMYFSTSKITFAGAGLAGMASSVENVKAIKDRIRIQMVGPDKMNQLRHMRFIKDLDGLLAHMDKHAALMRPKFEAVEETLVSELSEAGFAKWTKPAGGYFVSLDVMDGCAKRVVKMCAEAGVVLTEAGATFPYHNDPNDRNIRIAPTSPGVEELKAAIHVLGVCAKLAAAEKLAGIQ